MVDVLIIPIKKYSISLRRIIFSDSQSIKIDFSSSIKLTPNNRYNEIIEFVRGGLEDFSVSRETNKFGIPLPFDQSQVTYVWYDALFNYLTYCQEDEKKWWPADVHVIGKDIVRFHGIYWPAMLWSAEYETPHKLLTTGFFTIDGQKMSKSIGNVINPVEYISEHSRDMLALYLFNAFPI
jgi:methionyl-tRNA synthetase